MKCSHVQMRNHKMTLGFPGDIRDLEAHVRREGIFLMCPLRPATRNMQTKVIYPGKYLNRRVVWRAILDKVINSSGNHSVW